MQTSCYLCHTSRKTKTSSPGTTMSSTTHPRFQTCMNQNQTCKSYTTWLTMLGVMSKLAPGRSGDYQTDLQYWLANGFANIAPAVSTAVNAQPTTFAAFKQVGYLQFPTPDYALTPQGGLANFNLNPTANPINTPSGLIEIYSQQVAAFWGTSDPVATPVPHYIPSPENRLATPATSGKYPLELMTIHSFFSEHEQWHHMSWARDDPITFQNGYQTLWVNPD